MPTFGPGGQSINTAPAPTWIFTPTPNAPSTVRLWNAGNSIAYVGQNPVTAFNGFPIPPQCKPVELQNVSTTLYAVAAVTPGAGTNTVNTSSAVAGVTSFTVSGTVGLAVGGTVVIGIGNNREAFVVSGLQATSVTVSTASLYAHPTGDTVTTATLSPTALTIVAGAI